MIQFEGIQPKLRSLHKTPALTLIGTYGCLFLSYIQYAIEKHGAAPVETYDALESTVKEALRRSYVNSELSVLKPESLLTMLTDKIGFKVTREAFEVGQIKCWHAANDPGGLRGSFHFTYGEVDTEVKRVRVPFTSRLIVCEVV